MSEEQLKAFVEAVKADANLQGKLKSATSADDVVAIAKSAGFAISTEDLAKAQAEISEADLEAMAGGCSYKLVLSHGFDQCGNDNQDAVKVHG